jgi:hypothetical protein
VTGQEYTAGSAVSNQAEFGIEYNFTPRAAELFDLAASAENPCVRVGYSLITLTTQ